MTCFTKRRYQKDKSNRAIFLDDDKEYADFHKLFLESYGLKTEAVYDEESFYDSAKKNAPVNFVFVEQSINGKSGRDFIKKIKSNPEFSGTKFFLLSDIGLKDNDIDFVLTKPFLYKELLDKIGIK